MQLIYYKKDQPNFGDDLNATLWRSLAPELFNGAKEEGFVGIGTIIGMPCRPARLNVFSSGAGNDPPLAWRDKTVRYWCVRGPISARLLNLPAETAITDGAILTPLVGSFPSAASSTRGTVIVPHFQTIAFPGWQDVAKLTGFELIDPRGEVTDVIARIASARLVLAESLHAAIIADVYGIPWAAFATSKNFGVTKWVDWTASLGLDFHLTMVTPPHPGPLLKFGRPLAPYGSRTRFDAEAAMTLFTNRVAPALDRLSTLRRWVKNHPLTPRLMYSFSAARTAEQLQALTRAPLSTSAKTDRDRLQDRMAQLLTQVCRYAGAGAPQRTL